MLSLNAYFAASSGPLFFRPKDGDVTAGSRWSCQGLTGSECRIEYDLGASRDLSELRLGKTASFPFPPSVHSPSLSSPRARNTPRPSRMV